MTKDGIPICMSSINLYDSTDVQNSKFSSLASVVPEIQTKPGIFTFNLTWEEISTLRREFPYHFFITTLSDFIEMFLTLFFSCVRKMFLHEKSVICLVVCPRTETGYVIHFYYL